jgi:ketosteroid isomerase-like protein
MIKKLTLVLLIILTILNTTMAQDKNEKELASAVENLRIAMEEGNKESLSRLVSDDLSYGHSSGVIENKQQFIDKLVSGQSDFVTIQLSSQTITLSGETGIVRHRLDAKTNDNGKPGEAHLLILLVWQKEGESWKLLARQAVKAI